MNEQSRQDEPRKESVSDLTPAQVRQRIAERLGWRVLAHSTEYPQKHSTIVTYELYHKDDRISQFRVNYFSREEWHDPDLRWEWKHIGRHFPDWPADVGAALALCEQIAFVQSRQWDILIKEYIVNPRQRVAMFLNKVGACKMFVAIGDTSAEALARLALSALES